MSVYAEVLLWAQRVVGRKDAAPHQILEIPQTATMEAAQAAFHKIARLAHPDLHRTTFAPAELELVTRAYARAASAYQDFRAQCLQSGRIPKVGEGTPPPRTASRTTPPPATAPSGGLSAASAMSSKALIYYRKAELSLRRGDLKGALLQVKMAIAADPQSAFLRTALAEIEAELTKNP